MAQKQNPKYWTEVEIDNGVVVTFKDRYHKRVEAFENAISEMSPLGEGWRIFTYECNSLYNEHLVVDSQLIKVKNINEVY